MSGPLRSFLIGLGLSLFVFLTLGSWYWLQFRQPPTEDLARLRAQLPQWVELLEKQDDQALEASLDQVPMQIVVADAGQQALTSNLADGHRLRQQRGQDALKNGVLTRFIEKNAYRFYYQPPLNWLDLNLLFPLIFGLLLGLAAALWDLYQNLRLEDQTDTLILLSRGEDSKQKTQAKIEAKSEARLDALRDQNNQLKAQLLELKTRPEPTVQKSVSLPTANPAAASAVLAETDPALVRRLEQELKQVKQELNDSKLKLQSAQKTASLQNQENQQLKKQVDDQDDELNRLHQHHQELNQELEKVRERMQEVEQQAAQLPEAWQEIESLRKEQERLLEKEGRWQDEKRRLMGLFHEKVELLQKNQERLKNARQKINELSMAYKKQLEKILHLPEDLQHAQELLESLIDQKDLIEHDNLRLHLEQADKQSEIKRLQIELQVRADRLEHARRLIEELSGSLRSNQRELSLLSETLEDKLLDLDRIQDLHDGDSQVLEEVLQERDQLRLELSEQEEVIAQLQSDKSQLQAQKEAAEGQLQDVDMQSYQLEVEQLRQSLKLMGLQQQRRTQTVENLKTKLEESEVLYGKLKRHAEKQEREIHNLQEDIDRHRSEIEILETKLYGG